MKVIILAGGYGTRLSEYTDIIPKPMVQVGDKPILEHIMDIYSYFDHKDFYIALGYKAEIIKKFFSEYSKDILKSNLFVNLEKYKEKSFFELNINNWNINLLDTGEKTMTGGRAKRISELIGNETCMLTYGDGLADIDLTQLLSFHEKHGGLVTMTSIQLASRFGILEIGENERVTQFKEKPKENEAWINGGFFICEPEVLEYIDNDSTTFEKDPLTTLANERKLFTYQHHGFWKCMDTLRDKRELDELALSSSPPWKKR